VELPRVCSICNKITTIDEPLYIQESRGARDFYKLNPVDFCGNCGAAL